MEDSRSKDNEFEQIEGLTLGEILYLLKKNWKLIFFTTLICLTVGIVYSLCFAKTKWSASSSIIVQDDNFEGTSGIMYSSYLTSSLKEFMTSDEVTFEVAKEVLKNRYDITERTFKIDNGKEVEVLFKYDNGFKVEYIVENDRYYRIVDGVKQEYYFVSKQGTEYVYRVELDENGNRIGVLVGSETSYDGGKKIGVDDIIYIDASIEDTDNIIKKYYSKVTGNTYSVEEYDNMVRKTALKIKAGTSISTNQDAINMTVSYSQREDEFDTMNEVVSIVSLLISKSQEVAVRKVNTEPTYTFPMAEAERAVKYAYSIRYGMSEVYQTDEFGEYILDKAGEKILKNYYSSVYNKEYSIEEYNTDIGLDATNLMRDFFIYCESGQLFYGVKASQSSKHLDDLTAYYCIRYLSDYAYANPKDEYSQEYRYPLFANKITDSGITPTPTGSKGTTKILLISIVIGLVISIGISFVMYLTDDTYTTRDDLEKLTGAKVFAYVEKLGAKEKESR